MIDLFLFDHGNPNKEATVIHYAYIGKQRNWIIMTIVKIVHVEV